MVPVAQASRLCAYVNLREDIKGYGSFSTNPERKLGSSSRSYVFKTRVRAQ
jgi:hypothetical protein